MAGRASRRDVLRGVAGGALAAALPLAACGPARPQALSTTRLADDFAMFSGAGGNMLGWRGPEGLVLVDGGHADHADALLRAAQQDLGARDVAALFNSHWHRDQTGLNQRLGAEGVRIIAHENTRQWLSTDITRPGEEVTFEPLPLEARPTETFLTEGSMTLGGETIEYGHMLMAHTDGDIFVHFKNADILAVGGAVSNEGWPEVDWWTGGWFGGMLDGFDIMLARAGENTVIVPANGPVMTRAELAAQNEMYLAIFERMRGHIRSALGPAESVAMRPADGFKPEWGDPDRFVEQAFRSFFGHLRGSRRLGGMA